MAWLVVARPDFIARQTLVVFSIRPLVNSTEVTTGVFAVTVKVILLYTLSIEMTAESDWTGTLSADGCDLYSDL